MNKPYFIELKGQLEHGGIKTKEEWAIVGRVDIPKLVADIDSLSEENKRLREALEEIESSTACDFDSVRQIARQALGGETN